MLSKLHGGGSRRWWVLYGTLLQNRLPRSQRGSLTSKVLLERSTVHTNSLFGRLWISAVGQKYHSDSSVQACSSRRRMST